MRNNIFKIDYQIKTLKRARISFEIVNHNFLIKLSENQILNKINNFVSKVEVLVELGSNSSIGEMYSKNKNCLFISIDNSIDFLKQNSSSNNKIVIDENNFPFKEETVSGVISCLYVDSIIDSENLFSDVYKILKKDGFLIFSIFGTKTMKNVKECFVKIQLKYLHLNFLQFLLSS